MQLCKQYETFMYPRDILCLNKHSRTHIKQKGLVQNSDSRMPFLLHITAHLTLLKNLLPGDQKGLCNKGQRSYVKHSCKLLRKKTTIYYASIRRFHESNIFLQVFQGKQSTKLDKFNILRCTIYDASLRHSHENITFFVCKHFRENNQQFNILRYSFFYISLLTKKFMYDVYACLDCNCRENQKNYVSIIRKSN